MTSDLWSEAKILNSLILHDVYWNIGFLGQGIQIWHRLLWFDLSETTKWPLTSDQRSKSKSFFLPWCILKYRVFGSRNSNMILFFFIWPLRGHQMTFDLWSEVKIQIKGPLIFDQRSKLITILFQWCFFFEIYKSIF